MPRAGKMHSLRLICILPASRALLRLRDGLRFAPVRVLVPFPSVPVLAKGRKETSMWEAIRAETCSCEKGHGRLIPISWNVHDGEFPLLPAIEGGAGETNRPDESSETPAVSAAAATGMTWAATNSAAVVELRSRGPWRAG